MAVNLTSKSAIIGVGGGPLNHSFSSKNSNLGIKFAHFQPFHLNLTFNRSAKLRTLPLIRAQTVSEYVPETKFYKVEAILRPWRIPKVSAALLKMGIRGVTVSDVRGFGAQGGVAERHAGSEFSEDKFVNKVKMEIVVSKDQVDPIVDLIIQEARTGEIGDGKIFVLPVSDIIRVRTGERGEEAERMSGGRHDMSNQS
ncbi:nitrogen regulatory protein P-II homolog [Chenopodium quinoa]|uniref:nitrogen regulatory protein P-II homolog n=1 Tax=Chenopodium quinoa TaxID=63459 RepID=UPI000B76C666|nr:nitrogen regulatory protein P-II homolog [Chenopodium quinoa]